MGRTKKATPGMRITVARHDLKMTQTELARRIGVQPSWVSGIESGKIKGFSTWTLVRACEELEIDVDVTLAAFGRVDPWIVQTLLEKPSLARKVRDLLREDGGSRDT